MDEKFLKLTESVYKILEFFPESDPLKNRAKDKALAIMDNLSLIGSEPDREKIKSHILEDIDMLLGYLWIAKTQGWLNSVNYLIIDNEYKKIKGEIGPVIALSPTYAKEKPQAGPPNLSERQKKILDFLSKNDKAQVMDLQAILPDITKRTIRRDLDELLEMGKITRVGEFNQVFYKIARLPMSINQAINQEGEDRTGVGQEFV